MSTLKVLKERRKSVQSTRKITIAMKMVAGAKLRRAQEQVESARPYASMMARMLNDLAQKAQGSDAMHPLLSGTGKSESHLVVVATSDRGLCGGFNSSIVRHAKQVIRRCQSQGQSVKILCVGRKGFDLLKMDYGSMIIEKIIGIGTPRLEFSNAHEITQLLLKWFDDGEFDQCTVVYNQFITAMTQKISEKQLIPLKLDEDSNALADVSSVYEYEPGESEVLDALLPRNLAVQIYHVLMENAASEQGARMTAMDNASRNAADMIKRLELTYNRTRQAHITKELIEIISGAEAV